jgi:predicted AlkP superfamily pyrophosphatase or phosphodiesterase
LQYFGHSVLLYVSKDSKKISAGSAEQAPSPSAGLRPSFYEVFDPKAPSAVRVEKIHQWLSLPPRNRPELIMAYFDTVDYQSHFSGPDNEKVACTSLPPMIKE